MPVLCGWPWRAAKLPNFGPVLRNTSYLLLFAILVMFGCIDRPEYPIEPKIRYVGEVLNPNPVSSGDSIGFVRIAFTDGDGDLGLDPGDTLGQFAPGQPFYYNLFIHYFERQSNGTYTEIVPPLPFHARFKKLDPTNSGQPLEGTMDVGLFVNPVTTADSVKYHIYIADRAQHLSDTIVTKAIKYPF